MFRIMSVVFTREILLVLRKRSDLLNPLGFFILINCLLPLASSPDPQLLMKIGPGIIWMGALLATLLSLNRLFIEDHRDGCLEQMLLNKDMLPLMLLAKIFAHWCLFGLPLVIISPLLALMYHLPIESIGVLMLSLALGTLILNLFGAIISALTVGLGNNGFLLAILLVPIYIPPLIFGTSSVLASENHLSVSVPLMLLTAILILLITITPVVTAFALRIGVAYD